MERADDILVDSAMSMKWRLNPTDTATKRLPVVWKMAINSPSEGSVRISAMAVLTHADFTMKSGVKLFKGWLMYMSFVWLELNSLHA
jgi:hypothetical protein